MSTIKRKVAIQYDTHHKQKKGKTKQVKKMKHN